jgi:prephenate dehydratase
MRVAIQGQAASFHDQAARHLLGQELTILPCETFTDVFKTLDDGEADMAVVAIENTIHGAINDTYDLLEQYQFSIQAEHWLKIEQCLIGLPGATIQSIKHVYTHSVALDQCESFLETHLQHASWDVHHDTAGSVADVKKWGDPTKAAIASTYAAEYYGLPVLARNIETNHHNYTRFVVLAVQQNSIDQANKTSLILRTSHEEGALYKALGLLVAEHINLTLLVSRPIVGNPGHSRFYIDVSAGMHELRLQRALQKLIEPDAHTRVLGSYQAASRPWESDKTSPGQK